MAACLKKKQISLPCLNVQNVKVMVRVRPLSSHEEYAQTKNVVKCISYREIVVKEKKYIFDRVFGKDASQFDVYRGAVAPMIPDVTAGYHCTVFAYGQTGSGKTYTMTGDQCKVVSNWRQDPTAGCIPRAATHIFEELARRNVSNIKVSYLELYNEEIRDLLSDDDGVLNIFNDSKGSVVIQGLTEVTVHDSEGICRQLIKGINRRQTAPTLMNHQSSRSHTVFTITVQTWETSDTGEEVVKIGKLNLVDLAGSENIARSGCKDMRVVEMANINKSLLTLGRVIQAFSEKGPKHIPYRDSKLTRILQDSLGGHTKTCIIATISASPPSLDVTVSTLEYAVRARDIKNVPVVNEKTGYVSDSQYEEIEALRRELAATRESKGFYVDKANYEKLQNELKTHKEMKKNLDNIITEQKKEIELLESQLEEKDREYNKNTEQLKNLLKSANSNIRQKKDTLKQEQYLSKMYETEASVIQKEAEALLHTHQKNTNVMIRKLEQLYGVNASNYQFMSSTVADVTQIQNDLLNDCVQHNLTEDNTRQVLGKTLGKFKHEVQAPLDDIKNSIAHYETNLTQQSKTRYATKASLLAHVEAIKAKISNVYNHFQAQYDRFASIQLEAPSKAIEDMKTLCTRHMLEIYDVIQEMSHSLHQEDDDILTRIHKIQTYMEKRIQEDTEWLDEIQSLGGKTKKLAEKLSNGHFGLMDSLDNGTKEFSIEYSKIKEVFPTESELSTGEDLIVQLEQYINDNIKKNLENFEVSESPELATSLKQIVTSSCNRVVSCVDTEITSVNKQIADLLEEQQRFRKTVNANMDKMEKRISKDMFQKYKLVQPTGETPTQKCFLIQSFKKLSTRTVLLEKFNANRNDDTEDKENVPCDLNVLDDDQFYLIS